MRNHLLESGRWVVMMHSTENEENWLIPFLTQRCEVECLESATENSLLSHRPSPWSPAQAYGNSCCTPFPSHHDTQSPLGAVILLQQLSQILDHVVRFYHQQHAEESELDCSGSLLPLPQISFCSWLRKDMAKILACSCLFFFLSLLF